MISDSFFWKADLLKQASAVRSRMQQRRWTDASFARVEQTIMLGFYSIRKLNESKKLSQVVAELDVSLMAYRWSGKQVTRLNWISLDKLHDLESPETVTRSLTFLCNQIVHSYIFLPLLDEDHLLHSFVFASDREKHNWLYSLNVSQAADLFELVGSDDPKELHITMHNKGKQGRDYDVTLL